MTDTILYPLGDGKGYVRHKPEWFLGAGDLEVVNDARTSFEKESLHLTDRDIRLIRFLGRNEHTSPFRHSVIKLEARAPLMVARQWWKYVIGSDHDETPPRDPFLAWNESSRRYVTEEPEFYIPRYHQWREAPASRKQGSGGVIHPGIGRDQEDALADLAREGVARYQEALDCGVAAEQARLFLPAYALYARWRWTASLQTIAWFLHQRLAHDAQWEITQYARAVYRITQPLWEHSLGALLEGETPDD